MTRRTRCARSDDGWFKLTIPGARPGDALSIPHRRRDRSARPGVALPARRRARAERGDRSRPTTGRRAAGSAGRGTNAFFWSCMSAPSPRTARFAASSTSSTTSPSAGFTAIELMPVADFFGRWNWGYDGVLLYAPDSAYGRPDDLKALIDAAHQRGLMVFLDVVYNHFGPEGNYLGRYAPQFFSQGQHAVGQRHRLQRAARCGASRSRTRSIGSATSASTACGSMRCMRSPSPGAAMLLHELSEAVGTLAAETGAAHPSGAGKRRQPGEPARSAHRSAARQISRAMERRLSSRLPCAADRRDRGLLRRLSRARRGISRGRWPRGLPIRASRRRTARASTRGEPTSALPATAFVNFLQNHDQIGNRALGERLSVLAPAGGARSRACRHAARARAAADVHGRRMGRARAVSVLLRFQGRARRRGPQRPAKGIRRGLCSDTASEVPDPLAEQTVRLRDARLGGDRQARPSRAARSGAAAARGAQNLRHPAPAATSARPRHGGIRRTAC